MNRKSKIIIAITAAIVLVVVAVVTAVLITQKGSHSEYREHLELGNHYLDELEYEQAIAELRTAIEIEPNDSEAYLTLSEVYVAMGDYENACAVLQEGYDAIGDEEIKKELDGLMQEYESLRTESLQNGMPSAGEGNGGMATATELDYSSELERLLVEGAGDVIRPEELTWFGSHISTLDYETAKELLLADGFRCNEHAANGEYYVDGYKDENHVIRDGITHEIRAGITQNENENIVRSCSLSDGFGDAGSYTSDIRGIAINDSLEVVLEKAGFSNAGEIAAYMEGVWQNTYANGEEISAALRIDYDHWIEQEDGTDILILLSGYGTTELENGEHRLTTISLHIAYYLQEHSDYGSDFDIHFSFHEDGLLHGISLYNKGTSILR